MKKLSITVHPKDAQKIGHELLDSIVGALGVCYRQLLLGLTVLDPYGLGRILSGDTFLSDKVKTCNRMTAFITHIPIGVVVEMRFSKASEEVDFITMLYHRGYNQFFFRHDSFTRSENRHYGKMIAGKPESFPKLYSKAGYPEISADAWRLVNNKVSTDNENLFNALVQVIGTEVEFWAIGKGSRSLVEREKRALIDRLNVPQAIKDEVLRRCSGE